MSVTEYLNENISNSGIHSHLCINHYVICKTVYDGQTSPEIVIRHSQWSQNHISDCYDKLSEISSVK